MARLKTARSQRLARHIRVRRKINGTLSKPRLCVFRSLNHIYAQIVDDTAGHTLVTASSIDPTFRKGSNSLGKSDTSRLVGQVLSTKAKEIGIYQVVFDRGGYQYHGRVKALAEAAREGGLIF